MILAIAAATLIAGGGGYWLGHAMKDCKATTIVCEKQQGDEPDYCYEQEKYKKK